MKPNAAKAAPSRALALLWRLRVGPGLILAVVLSVILWIYRSPDRAVPTGRPIVERVPAPARGPAATPDVSDLLKHADALALTPRQRNRIGLLAKQWEPESAERRREMDAAAEAFSTSMREAQRRGTSDLGEVQRNATPVSALTSQWLARKADFWRRGLAELTPEQRQRAEKSLPPSLHRPKGADIGEKP